MKDNFKLCYIENDSVVESENKKINTVLLPLFFEKTKNIALEMFN